MSNKIIDAVCKPYIEAKKEMKAEKEMRERIMSNKPKQGDTLYLDVTAVSKEPKSKPVTVSKEGRVYFSVDGKDIPFSNKSLLYEAKSFPYNKVQLYRTEQEIHDMHQLVYLRGVIYHEVMQNRHLLKLDQLQRISNILNEKK